MICLIYLLIYSLPECGTGAGVVDPVFRHSERRMHWPVRLFRTKPPLHWHPRTHAAPHAPIFGFSQDGSHVPHSVKRALATHLAGSCSRPENQAKDSEQVSDINNHDSRERERERESERKKKRWYHWPAALPCGMRTCSIADQVGTNGGL